MRHIINNDTLRLFSKYETSWKDLLRTLYLIVVKDIKVLDLSSICLDDLNQLSSENFEKIFEVCVNECQLGNVILPEGFEIECLSRMTEALNINTTLYSSVATREDELELAIVNFLNRSTDKDIRYIKRILEPSSSIPRGDLEDMLTNEWVDEFVISKIYKCLKDNGLSLTMSEDLSFTVLRAEEEVTYEQVVQLIHLPLITTILSLEPSYKAKALKDLHGPVDKFKFSEKERFSADLKKVAAECGPNDIVYISLCSSGVSSQQLPLNLHRGEIAELKSPGKFFGFNIDPSFIKQDFTTEYRATGLNESLFSQKGCQQYIDGKKWRLGYYATTAKLSTNMQACPEMVCLDFEVLREVVNSGARLMLGAFIGTNHLTDLKRLFFSQLSTSQFPENVYFLEDSSVVQRPLDDKVRYSTNYALYDQFGIKEILGGTYGKGFHFEPSLIYTNRRGRKKAVAAYKEKDIEIERKRLKEERDKAIEYLQAPSPIRFIEGNSFMQRLHEHSLWERRNSGQGNDRDNFDRRFGLTLSSM